MTQPTPFHITFLSPKFRYRQLHGGGLSQLIAKAVGIKGNHSLKVLDCTAGLGEDAWVLANLGCEVHMLERSPIVADALQTALQELQQTELGKKLQLKLTHCNALDYLQSLDAPIYDVIYLDPMFPIRKKTALSKKTMRTLRDIVGEDNDANDLLLAALPKAKNRIVVKRHRHAPYLAGLIPDFNYVGKSSRFDVYRSKH